MPVQTTSKNFVFPDGAKVSIKESGAGTYTDVGAISTSITNTLNYDENQIDTANAGKTVKQIKNMTVAGGFTLINWDLDVISKLGGGLFTKQTTAGTPTTTVDDQVIAIGAWAYNSVTNLVMIDGGVTLKANAMPTITSVVGSVDGALTADLDYVMIADPNSPSGFSILIVDGTAVTTTNQTITVNYNSVTPKTFTKLLAGSSTQILNAYAMKVTHTDDNNKVREVELFSVDGDSGGFQFNFKGANEDGLEELPLTYTAKLDTSLTSGQQLISFSFETGAQ